MGRLSVACGIVGCVRLWADLTVMGTGVVMVDVGGDGFSMAQGDHRSLNS